MGFTSAIQGYAKAGQYSNLADSARKRGSQAQQAAYSQANAAERSMRTGLGVAGQNLRTMRGNQNAALATARVATADSGLDGTGTSNQRELNAQDMLDAEIANATQSISTQSINTYSNVLATRKSGDIAAASAEAEAHLYDTMARGTKNATTFGLATSILGTALGAYQGYNKATDYNAAIAKEAQTRGLTGQAKDDFLNKYSTSVWQSTGAGGIQGSNAGWSLGASLNPYTAGLNPSKKDRLAPTTVEDWNKHMSFFGWGDMRKYTMDEKLNPFIQE